MEPPPQMHSHRGSHSTVRKNTDTLELLRQSSPSAEEQKSVSQNCTGKELQRVVGSRVVRVTARPQYRTVGCVKTVRMRIPRRVLSDCLQLQSNSQSFRTACNISQIHSHFPLPATSVKFTVISDCLQLGRIHGHVGQPAPPVKFTLPYGGISMNCQKHRRWDKRCDMQNSGSSAGPCCKLLPEQN